MNRPNSTSSVTRRNIEKSIKAQGGFSLIELIVVIAIMAVLAGLLVPAFTKYVKKNRIEACRHNREAVLDIYARCVYDDSVVDIVLTADGFHKATGLKVSGGSVGAIDSRIENELKQYLACPCNSSDASVVPPWTVGVDTNTGTAYISCSKCVEDDASKEDVVSLDMLGWSATNKDKGAANEVKKPAAREEETTEEAAKVLVTFNLNGHGSMDSSEANPQEVKAGSPAKEPKAPQAATYNFGGWYTESDCINRWSFSTPVNENITLYAKWTGMNQDTIWPYSDDSQWWDPDQFCHGDSVASMDIGKNTTYNNKWIVLKAPSGIFTSKAGSQFVYVEENGDQKIYFQQAQTPEYYSALHPSWLIQLTGNKTTYDITSMNNNEQVNLGLLTNGDLVEFRDGNTSYMYVFWNSQENAPPIPVSSVRAYTKHPSNMYRVNSAATTIE